MPRAGGEADKLGNLYEGLWTVDAVLDLLDGVYIDLVVERIGREANGFEFEATTSPGMIECHSIKRQQADGHWTIGRLAASQANGRSLLGDLLVGASEYARVVFSSGTSATQLEELSDRARKSDSLEDFLRAVQQSGALSAQFQQRIVPLCGDDRTAYAQLARVHVRIKNEPELQTDVERRIRSSLRRVDGGSISGREVALLIWRFVLDHMGLTITAPRVRQWLQTEGISPLRLAGDAATGEQLDKRNRLYLNEVEARLINETAIPREEAALAIEQLTGSRRSVMLEGHAGDGKSCAFAQVVRVLTEQGVPCLALRLDRLAENDRPASRLGRNMGLPDSPAITLGEFAGDQPSVLCIDQVDAVSVVSARQQWAWDTFMELLDETRPYPHMRILLCCRSFDLDRDPRLFKLAQDEDAVERVRVGKLGEETIHSTLEAAGLADRVLTHDQLLVLGSPLHLYLFLDGSRSEPLDFTGAGDLFDRYWRDKSRAVNDTRPGTWPSVIQTLCDTLSQREVLSVSRHLLDEHAEALDLLTSQGVVTISGDHVGFFHESFFDYAFARTFETGGGNLVDWLKADDQHLFRRSQVRQVLAFLRRNGIEDPRYLQTLAGLLQGPEIRFHIKQLVLDWLGGLQDPTEQEWRCMEVSAESLGERRWDPIWNSVPWFDLLREKGLWAEWLSGDAEHLERAFSMIQQESVVEARPSEVILLVKEMSANRGDRESRLWRLATWATGYGSEEMQELLLELVRTGVATREQAFDRNIWSVLSFLRPTATAFSIRVVAAWFDQEFHEAERQDQVEDLGLSDLSDDMIEASNEIISEAAASNPELFARTFWPRLAKLERAAPMRWLPLQGAGHHPFEHLRWAVVESLRRLAPDDPDLLDALLVPGGAAESIWIDYVVLHVWSGNPDRYANQIVDFILERPDERLTISSSAGEDSFVAVTRSAVVPASAVCSDEAYRRLEEAILHFSAEWERKSRSVGRTEITLLRCLPPKRMSSRASRRLQELERRFPDAPERGAPTADDESEPKAMYVPSPVPGEAARKMTDDQWQSAIEKHSEDGVRWQGDRLVGGAGGLAQELERATRSDPVRFAQFAERLQASHAPVYIESILRGLTLAEDGSHRQPEPGTVFAVVRRMAALRLPLRRNVAWALRDAASERLPEDMLAILVRMATAAPDPVRDDWSGAAKPSHREPDDHGLNSDRGAAAGALARVLFTDQTLWEGVKPVVTALAQDLVLSVRASAVECLVAVLDSDREDALSCFRLLLRDAEPLLGTRPIERFLRYAMYRDYSAVRSILIEMLTAPTPRAPQSAARLVTLAGLDGESDLAQSDASQVMGMGAEARRGAAEVYARNVASDIVGSESRERLIKLFDDPDVDVRREAARCWIHMEPDDTRRFGQLLTLYARSSAFGDSVQDYEFLSHRLGQSGQPLPSEFIEFLEESLQLRKSIGTPGALDMYELPNLAIRMHEETRDPKLRTRILDTIDEMMKMGVRGMTNDIKRRFER